MRVISGKAKSLKLKTVEGMDTRPTTDRIKETLFNMINNQIYDCLFLDLFSGSGAIGIEALSRGAKQVFFVDNSVKCKKCIEDNLVFTKLQDGAKVICGDVINSINQLETSRITFDIIFMDPPYDCELEKNVLQRIASSVIADTDTLLIVEASLNTDFDYLDELGYELIKEKKYKTNKHVYIMKNSDC